MAETTYTPFQSESDTAPVRLIARRVNPTPGSQLALFATYSYHGFITDRDEDTLELEADHRRHAAWLAVQVIAHNLPRWAARIGLGEAMATTKTLRRRFFSVAVRLTRAPRRLTLHLPQCWPWEAQFNRALA